MQYRSIQRAVKAITLSVFLLASMTLTAGPVGAASSPVAARAQVPSSCVVQATGNGFAVSWQSPIEAGWFVVERSSLNRFWWRGRSDDPNSTFVDSAAPVGAASITYRIVAKTTKGGIIATIPCQLESSTTFVCAVTQLQDGRYEVNWTGQPDGQDRDVVVRRTVRPDRPSSWRTRSTGTSFADSSSPTGPVTYELYARTGARIAAYTSCPAGLPAGLCDPAVTNLPRTECEVLHILNELGMGEDPLSKPCQWKGIRCIGNHVETIRPKTRLSGPIPPELGRLKHLKDLRLVGLTGQIPPELGQITSLSKLGLSGGGLAGPIPPELGNLTNLESLTIRNTNVSGPIPRELGDLARLTVLDLSENQLTGPIPSELGRLSHLNVLQVHLNQLTGSIPAELGSLKLLDQLALGSNQLTGPIPAELGDMQRMNSLSLTDNQLSGPIPVELGQLTQLRYLSVAQNQLTGDVTNAFTGSFDTLQRVWLSDGAGGNNCFTSTDPIVSAWLTARDASWDECN